jgi:LysM repeat protein
MNTPNPLIPQGTLPESRSKTHTRIVVFSILAVHVVLLCVLLLQGCKRTTDTGLTEATNTPPPFEPPPTFVGPSGQPPVITQPTSPPPSSTPPTVTPPPQQLTAPPPAPTEPEKEHTVAKGDSFYTISKKYGVTVRAIAEVNPGVDSSRLKIGQKLKIPASSAARAATNGGGTAAGDEKTYTVKSGDTLMKIAKSHGVTVKALRSANNLRTDRITVGQKIKIPAKTAAQPAAEPAPVPGFTPPQPTGTPAPGANI